VLECTVQYSTVQYSTVRYGTSKSSQEASTGRESAIILLSVRDRSRRNSSHLGGGESESESGNELRIRRGVRLKMQRERWGERRVRERRVERGRRNVEGEVGGRGGLEIGGVEGENNTTGD
jgi:hypothetical protein